MAQNESYKYEDELEIVRRQNRALRSINRSLRKRLHEAHQHTDEVFLALCEDGIKADLVEFDENWQEP